jgi:hypothetical protein
MVKELRPKEIATSINKSRSSKVKKFAKKTPWTESASELHEQQPPVSDVNANFC